MKYLYYLLITAYLFVTFVIMAIGMISPNTPWYVQLIICFLGAPTWIWMVCNVGRFADTFIKD